MTEGDTITISAAALAEAKRIIGEWEVQRLATKDPQTRAMYRDMIVGALSVLVHLGQADDVSALTDLTPDERGPGATAQG
jgi:hypothetical protein